MSEFADKQFVDRECAIYVNTEQCTPTDILRKIAGDNAARPTNIIENLKKQTNCTTELCVIESHKISSKLGRDLVNKIINNYFKIKGPKYDIEKWLSNDDIDNTLAQWSLSNKFSDFNRIPFQMRDFQKNQTELATIDMKDMFSKGFRTFGCVPNTDWSTGNGQHWFALFFDFRKEPYTLEYFNSSGECPLKEFNSWMNEKEQSLQNQFEKPIKKIIVTRVQNQYDNSSCGCYSLYYIYKRLNGTPWIWFRQNKVPDKHMHEFRKFLFNPE